MSDESETKRVPRWARTLSDAVTALVENEDVTAAVALALRGLPRAVLERAAQNGSPLLDGRGVRAVLEAVADVLEEIEP